MASVRCPTCGKQFDSQQSPAMPFCSERCRLVDLGRWLDERYGMPHVPDESPEEMDDEPPDEEG